MRLETVVRLAGIAGVLALAASAPAPAAAQSGPMSCTAANQGQTVCQAEGRCRCSYNAGGTMMRDPPGYRWDCSLLLGKCSPGSAYPEISHAVTPGPMSAGGAPGRLSPAQIRAAQSELMRLGFNPGPIDGVMGRRTAGAVRSFQRQQKLPDTGTLNQETLSRLRVAG